MVKILRVKLTDLINVYRIIHSGKNEIFSYFSDFRGGILKCILTYQCFYIIKNDSASGLLLLNRNKKEALYIPAAKNDLSLFRLIYTVSNNLNLKGYTLSIRHNSLNPKLYKNYLPVNITENYKYMCIDINENNSNSINIHEKASVRKMVIGREEPIRVKLQNDIFGNIEGRRELSIIEVYNEESKSTFLKDMCFILDIEGDPAGYGQILIIEGEYYLVNFGVTNKYRNRGLGRYFLSEIIYRCCLFGINHLYLCVDNDNLPAINLYAKIGFKELYNKFDIVFK